MYSLNKDYKFERFIKYLIFLCRMDNNQSQGLEYKLSPILKSTGIKHIAPAIEFTELIDISHMMRGYDTHSVSPVINWLEFYKSKDTRTFLTGSVFENYIKGNKNNYNDIDILVVSPSNQEALTFLQELDKAVNGESTFQDELKTSFLDYQITQTRNNQDGKIYVCGEIEAAFRFDPKTRQDIGFIPRLYGGLLSKFMEQSRPIEVSIMTAKNYNSALNDNQL